MEEVIFIRLFPNKINRESGIGIPGFRQSKTVAEGEPHGSGRHKEPDPKDAPITAVDFHPIIAE